MGISVGLIWGFSLFFMTVWAVIFADRQSVLLDGLKPFYFGYGVSFRGAILGFIYGCIDGLMVGSLVAWLYNIFQTKEK